MKRLIITTLCGLFFLASPAVAVLTEVDFQDGPQDPLFVPSLVHELGLNFPPEELIESDWALTDYVPCQENPDNPDIPNVEVMILNLTDRSWTDLWYVSDPETSLANDDGLINGELAFKIDYGVLNAPLVLESMAADGVFQPGEMWVFVIQDYVNQLALPPSALGSIGVPTRGDDISSGSIIAIPEPATIAMLGLGSLVLLRRKRKV